MVKGGDIFLAELNLKELAERSDALRYRVTAILLRTIIEAQLGYILARSQQ